MVEDLEFKLTGEANDLAIAQEVIEALSVSLRCELVLGEQKSSEGPISTKDTLENYIILPGQDRPDILVGMNKLASTSEVKHAARRLHLTLRRDSRGLIEYLNHEEALMLVESLDGSFPLSLAYFRDFLKHLHDGINGEIKVYDGIGRKLSKQTLNTVWDKIAHSRDWRAEWLSDRYSGNGELSVTYHKVTERGIIEVTEPLQNWLREDKSSAGARRTSDGIELIHWLNNSTPHGLPKVNNPPPHGLPKEDVFNYSCPKGGKSVRFVSYYNETNLLIQSNLECCWGYLTSGPSLGVRRAKMRV